jgi:hypothetical protein
MKMKTPRSRGGEITRVHSVVAACLLVSCFISPAARANVDRAVFMRLAASVLKVEAVKDSGGVAIGTAVTVAPQRVVTNCHVTREAHSISLEKAGRRWKVMSQLADPEHDLCLLFAPGLKSAPVALGATLELLVGQPVVAVSYGGGVGMHFSEGAVTALHRFDGGPVVQSDAGFTAGASGGGLFDQDGSLVGVLTFRLPMRGAYFFAAPVEWFCGRVHDAGRYAAIAPLPTGKSYWERADAEQPYFLRAASLAAGNDWEGLLRLTDDWIEAERANSEPWRSRGLAYSRTERDQDALGALREAVRRDPADASAWFDLGHLYVRLNRAKEIAEVRKTLAGLNPRLAVQLEKEITRPESNGKETKK